MSAQSQRQESQRDSIEPSTEKIFSRFPSPPMAEVAQPENPTTSTESRSQEPGAVGESLPPERVTGPGAPGPGPRAPGLGLRAQAPGLCLGHRASGPRASGPGPRAPAPGPRPRAPGPGPGPRAPGPGQNRNV